MIYEYLCNSCYKITEEYRAMDDRLTKGTCPDCGGITNYKFSVQTFTGSGEGWCGKLSNKGKSKVSLYNEKDGHRHGFA
jgi:putative FmdB family regulatory protein